MSYVKIGTLKIGNDADYLFKGITDSASGDVNRRTAEYVGVDGCDYADITYTPRTVSVKGFLQGKTLSETAALKSALIIACDSKKAADIIYNNGVNDYYAGAYCELPVFSKINNRAYEFTVRFDIHRFWWQSGQEIITGVYIRDGNIYGAFSLPRAFTVRTQGADIRNNGHAEAPPVFKINVSEGFTDDIEIKNVTYGKKIKLSGYTAAAGEVITIDCDECTVSSTANGNIVSYLSDDSEFFKIPLGYSRIECAKKGLTISCIWRERFLGV